MKIFNAENFDERVIELRTRCAMIITSSTCFGENFIPLVKNECVYSGFNEMDNEDFDYISAYAKLYGKEILLDKTRKVFAASFLLDSAIELLPFLNKNNVDPVAYENFKVAVEDAKKTDLYAMISMEENRGDDSGCNE